MNSDIKLYYDTYDSWHLNAFLSSLNVCDSVRKKKKRRLYFFLQFLQNIKLSSPSDIKYEHIIDYCEACLTNNLNKNYIYLASDLLKFWESKGMCLLGLCWYPFFLLHNSIVKTTDFSKEELNSISTVLNKKEGVSYYTYASSIPRFLEEMQSMGYSRTQLLTSQKVLYSYLVFLGMNDFPFHTDIYSIWLKYKKGSMSWSSWTCFRRILKLYDCFLQDNRILSHSIFREKKPAFINLPLWCKCELESFLKLKNREGLDVSTVVNYRSSVTRFCIFLVNQGLTSFSQITADIIKCYNRTDVHYSPESKNAYNCRLRKFLQYLERKEILPFGISMTLYSKSAQHEKIVKTLSDDEKKTIYNKLSVASSPMELRNKVIILLGMKMGLRPCDIVSIKRSDVDFDNQAIHVMQDKTERKILLPMPVVVGNAIYLYLKNGRPDSDCESLIIRHYAPFDSIKASTCTYLLHSYIPDEEKHRLGFSITRKTFSTDRLRCGTKMQIIAELDGHRNLDSLKRYLNLDNDKMRLCALSLSETNLSIEEDYFGNI